MLIGEQIFLVKLKSSQVVQKANPPCFQKFQIGNLVQLKVFGDIILKYGYVSTVHFSFIDLYVTVSNNPNRQGLFLVPDFCEGHLLQNYIREEEISDVCLWEFTTLKKALWHKNDPATLWVDAEKRDGR